jgi:hypothetical protein
MPRKIKRPKRRTRQQSRPPEHAMWAKLVKTRDKQACRECGCTDRKILHAHHIRSWEDYPNLRYDVNNGITLCIFCHAAKHPEVAHLMLKTHRVHTDKSTRIIRKKVIKKRLVPM